MIPIKPFTIAVPDAQLDQLRQKLEQTTYPDELDDAGWDMGAPLAEIKRLITAWRDNFDWRAQEQKLNEQLHQFIIPVCVDGFGDMEIHVVHHQSANPRAIPLLFIHGCMVLSSATIEKHSPGPANIFKYQGRAASSKQPS